MNEGLELDEVAVDGLGVEEVTISVKVPEKTLNGDAQLDNGELLKEEPEDLSTAYMFSILLLD